MALEATHIRLALDLKENVFNLGAYVSGTIYPDSRYVTKIDRNLTHPQDYMGLIRGDDDFKKGWAIHLLCDNVQAEITREQLPEIFLLEDGQGSEMWIHRTALKILQDIDDAKRYAIEEYLPLLDHIEAPNEEDPVLVLEYNRIFQKMYLDPYKVTVETHCLMWKRLGISDDLIGKVKEQAQKYMADERVMWFLGGAYDLMLERSLIALKK